MVAIAYSGITLADFIRLPKRFQTIKKLLAFDFNSSKEVPASFNIDSDAKITTTGFCA
ncbi:hypothetical protein KBT16_28365 [Nostoc sp. CCCryo 231-06]|nr:hypothetical protein [Nostoc sp. CCCryo 231-06]